MQQTTAYACLFAFMFFTELFIFCAMATFLIASRSNGWVKSVGKLTILDLSERQSLFGNSMKVISKIEYRYEYADNSYVGKRIYPFGLGPIGWEIGAVLRVMPPVGEKIDVFIDPVNPGMSSVVNRRPYGLLTIFGVIAFVGLGASCFALLAYQLDLMRVILICLMTLLPALVIGFLIYKLQVSHVTKRE